MGFKLNLTNDEIKQAQGTFEALPAGTYSAVIFENTFKYSKATPPNPMFEINFKITDGPAGRNRKIKAWFVLAGKGLFKIVELHKALGFDVPKQGGEFEFPEAEEYIGKDVNLVLGVKEFASVANDNDVNNGVLNSETGDPVRVTGEPVTKKQNEVKYVRAYDPDNLTTEEDLAEREEAQESGLFL